MGRLPSNRLTKHQVLVDYLLRYFQQRLLNARGRERFRITLIDGFCGGGLYQIEDTGELVAGSPLRILRAVEEASFTINQGRPKQILFDVQFIFIDKDRKALNHLQEQAASAKARSQSTKAELEQTNSFQK